MKNLVIYLIFVCVFPQIHIESKNHVHALSTISLDTLVECTVIDSIFTSSIAHAWKNDTLGCEYRTRPRIIEKIDIGKVIENKTMIGVSINCLIQTLGEPDERIKGSEYYFFAYYISTKCIDTNGDSYYRDLDNTWYITIEESGIRKSIGRDKISMKKMIPFIINGKLIFIVDQSNRVSRVILSNSTFWDVVDE